MGKNIVVFSDGTGQKGGVKYNTNVYKLFNMVEDRTKRQVAFYDPGCGTDMRFVTGNLFGKGFNRNIMDCYNFIFQNFEADDEIYLFGFSRGAATVRSLSGFISLFGILPKCRQDLVKQAFRIYQIKNNEQKTEQAKAFISRNSTMHCKIKFVGVWDTVAALGFPVKAISALLDRFMPHLFHSYDLSKDVQYARHALAIDDERVTFHPLLWDKLNDDGTGDRMKQVWFCGVHTDVGGGYEKDDLSYISLAWMIQEATDKGLLLYEKGSPYKKYEKSIAKLNPFGEMHDEQKGFFGKLFRRGLRSWNVKTHGIPTIHESVFERAKSTSNAQPLYKPWILNNLQYIIEPYQKTAVKETADVLDETLL
jgi:uncharacterized protein (DUF2235 family)